MMGTEQFSLKWNNHTNHLVDVFGNLLQAESLVDVTLSCEGQSLKAHKLVLSACSPYFKALFQDHVEKHPIVILKDVKFSELRCIIDFMYKGEVEVEKNDLDSLFLTAEGLMIKGLAGSRPPVSGVRLRVPPVVVAETGVERKRSRPAAEPFDSGGESGGGGTPASPPAGQPTAPCSNGEEGTVIKRPKLEPVSGEENSTDGMETAGAAGTAYLCRECGCSFLSQTQLQDHLSAAHGASRGASDTPASGGGVIRGPPGRGRTTEDSASAAPPVHSHSWPPHDGRERQIWTGEGSEQTSTATARLAYLPAGLRTELGYLPSLVTSGIGGGLLGIMPLMRGRHLTAGAELDGGRGPLNLSAGDGGGAASPGASEERSEPSTPTPADEGGPVTCKVCTRVFETPAALRDHAIVHQGERPFKCEYCGKAFKFRHHLKDHCRIHTGERPFDCKTCGKSFARSSILKTHTKIHRQEERRFELAAPFLSSGGVQNLATANLATASLSEMSASLQENPERAERAERAERVTGTPPPPSPPPGAAEEPDPLATDPDPLAVKVEPTELQDFESGESGGAAAP